jgi:hypothetical protein
VCAQRAGNLFSPAMQLIPVHYVVPCVLPGWKQDRKR